MLLSGIGVFSDEVVDRTNSPVFGIEQDRSSLINFFLFVSVRRNGVVSETSAGIKYTPPKGLSGNVDPGLALILFT
jgi:hypothetical protein